MTLERTVYVVSLGGDLAVLNSLKALLYSVGYKVRVFATEHDFFAAYEHDWFGCVVADTLLSDAEKLEFFELIAARNIDIPIIVATVCDPSKIDAVNLPDKVVALLCKPFLDQALVDAIEQAFARHQDR